MSDLLAILRGIPSRACVALLVIVLISCCQGIGGSDPFEDYLDSVENTRGFSGSYLVARGDSVLARGGRGFASLEDGRLNRPGTRFLIGSMTKPFTAVAVLQLVEDGLVNLDDPVAKYIDTLKPEVAGRVTIHDLLSHRSGIPDVIENPEFLRRSGEPISPRKILELIVDIPLAFDPGTRFAYSSSNYILLGLIIESVGGLGWEQYIQQRIIEPASMQSTGLFNDYAVRSDFARGYAPGPSDSPVRAPSVHLSRGYAAGALASTVDDLHLFCDALNAGTLLGAKSLQAMVSPHSPDYGYGWLLGEFEGHPMVGHGGGAPGFISMLMQWPDDSVCVIVLSNMVTAPVFEIALGLAAIALDEEFEVPK
jgi:CubicO group peptidase (beta-lactamase class C family)